MFTGIIRREPIIRCCGRRNRRSSWQLYPNPLTYGTFARRSGLKARKKRVPRLVFVTLLNGSAELTSKPSVK
jgi:hypothetical protein